MLFEDAIVYGLHGFVAWETKGKDCKVAQKTRCDGEGPSSGIHARNILCIVDFFKNEFGAVVPVVVIEVLSDDGVWLHREVLVYLCT